MRPIAPTADRAVPTIANGPSGAVHETTLERALGRIFAMFIALIVLVFLVRLGNGGLRSRPAAWRRTFC